MVRARLSLSRGSHLGPDRGNDACRRADLVTRNKPCKSSKLGRSRTIAIPLAAVLAFVLPMTTVLRAPRGCGVRPEARATTFLR
jgi:hypothetical protein